MCVVGCNITVCVSTIYDVRTTIHFSERIPVVKRRMTVYYCFYKPLVRARRFRLPPIVMTAAVEI